MTSLKKALGSTGSLTGWDWLVLVHHIAVTWIRGSISASIFSPVQTVFWMNEIKKNIHTVPFCELEHKINHCLSASSPRTSCNSCCHLQTATLVFIWNRLHLKTCLSKPHGNIQAEIRAAMFPVAPWTTLISHPFLPWKTTDLWYFSSIVCCSIPVNHLLPCKWWTNWFCLYLNDDNSGNIRTTSVPVYSVIWNLSSAENVVFQPIALEHTVW